MNTISTFSVLLLVMNVYSFTMERPDGHLMERTDMYVDDAIKSGWTETKPLQHFAELGSYDLKNEGKLFVKTIVTRDETTYIVGLARRLGIKEVDSIGSWQKDRRKIYLWIAREKVKEFEDKSGFKLKSKL